MNFSYLKSSISVTPISQNNHISNSISQTKMLKIQYLTYANISKPYLKSNLAHISHTGLYLTYANISKPYLKSLFAHISHTISYLNTFSRQGLSL